MCYSVVDPVSCYGVTPENLVHGNICMFDRSDRLQTSLRLILYPISSNCLLEQIVLWMDIMFTWIFRNKFAYDEDQAVKNRTWVSKMGFVYFVMWNISMIDQSSKLINSLTGSNSSHVRMRYLTVHMNVNLFENSLSETDVFCTIFLHFKE